MTDKSKIEAAASIVAMEKVKNCFSEGETDRVRARAHKAAKYAYLAGHASRDEEVKAKDEEIATLRAKLEAAEKRAARWVNQSAGGGCAEVARLHDAGWKTATGKYRNAEWWSLLVPPVPLPETKP